jgi:hypothetical protein
MVASNDINWPLTRWIGAIIVALPLVAAAIYLVEYLYVFNVLHTFGVSPEQTGITEVKLITRAGVEALIAVGIFGGSVVIYTVGVVLVNELASWLRRRFRTPPALPVSVDRETYAAWRIQRDARVRREQRERWRLAYVALALPPVLTTLLVANTDWQATPRAIDVALVWLTFGLATYAIRRIDLQLRAAMLLVSIVSIACVALLVNHAGAAAGRQMANTGAIPNDQVFGLDIAVVEPKWLRPAARPTGYAGEALLELGSDSSAVYLYACHTQKTYSVPIIDVVLQYAVTDAPNVLLKCRR